MKNTRLILLLSVAVLLASCDQKENFDDERPETPVSGVPLQIGSGISATVTRAFDTSWDAGNTIGVFTTKTGTTTITKSGTQYDENIPYSTATVYETYNSSTHEYTYRPFTKLTEKQIYLPADGSAVDVYAYYPYLNSVSASVPLSISIPTTQTLDNQKGVDVLKAKVLSTESAPVDIDHPTQYLLFEHVMSKVIVYVMSGTGYSDDDLSGNKVSSVQLLGQPTAATYAPVSQELTITAGSNTITMQEVEDTQDPDYASTYTIPSTSEVKNVLHVYRAIILPNNTSTNPVTTGSERQIKFNVGSTNYTYDMTETFSPGAQTVFAMRLSATGLDVWAAIKDWSQETITPNPLYPQED